jgi:hypothetical protein
MHARNAVMHSCSTFADVHSSPKHALHCCHRVRNRRSAPGLMSGYAWNN